LLGDVRLWLNTGKDNNKNLPNKVALVRKTGMVIHCRQFRSTASYVGVFLCNNEKGNKALRLMEPPAHNKWDVDLPEKGASKKYDQEYSAFIRECIKEIGVKTDEKSDGLAELSKFIPDDEPGNSSSSSGAEKAAEAFPDKQKESKETKSIAIAISKPPKPSTYSEADGDEAEGTGDEEEEKPRHGDEEGDGESGESEAEKVGSGPKSIISSRFRAFALDSQGAKYRLIIRPDVRKKTKAYLNLFAIGDSSGPSMLLQLANAKLGNKKVEFTASGRIGPLTLSKGQVAEIEIVLQNPDKFALEATVYEAE